MKRHLLLALLAGSILTGCSGYRVGSMLPADIETIAVPTFVNRTKEPLLEVDCTQSTIEQLQLDGSLQVVDADEADAVLEVMLTDFRLEPLAFRKDRTTAAREYRCYIFAAMVMKDPESGAILAQSPSVRGEAVFEVIGDLTSSKLRAIPVAADDLGKNLVERIVEAWQ